MDFSFMPAITAQLCAQRLRDVIGDEDLAAEASRVERDLDLDAQATRAALHAAVEQRYTHSA
jgi:hypothetical protein